MRDLLPTDLLVVVGVVAGAAAALLLPGVPWPIEWAFGIPLLVFVPGYALVSTLFPGAPEPASDDAAAPPDWPARIALSLLGSAVVVAVGGTLLAMLELLGLASIVTLLGLVSLLGVGGAALRRRRLPAAQRATPLSGVSIRGSTSEWGPTRSQSTSGWNVSTAVFVVAVLALAGALAFAGGTAASDDPYSEAYLSTSGDATDIRADNGTRTLVAAEPNPIDLTIANHEGAETTYTVVFQLQSVDEDGAVTDQQRLDRFQTQLSAGETAVHDREVSPTIRGDRLRLRTLIYVGSEVDGEPDLSLRHWITVDGGSA